MSVSDRLLLRKRAIVETVNDKLKNIAQVEHSGHRCLDNFIVNLLGAIAAYCLFPKKPCINLQRTIDTQLALFWIHRTHVNINNIQNIELGTGDYIFDYTNLSIDELYYLLHPSSKTQVPKLMEAIRSLKMSKLDTNTELASYYKQDPQGISIVGNIYKAKKAKRSFEVFYYNHIVDIEDKSLL